MVFRKKINLLTSFVLLFSGCGYYSLKGSMPANINSIFISPIVNDTSEFLLSEMLGEDFTLALIKENIIKIKSKDNADSQLDIKITRINDIPSSISGQNSQVELVEEWKLTIYLNILWYDLDDGDEIINKNITSSGYYGTGQDIGNDGIDNDADNLIDGADSDEFGLPRESAIRIAIEKISEKIINELISTW